MSSIPLAVDVHTHIYPPSYISLLRSRTGVPYLLDLPDGAAPRLVILPSDDDPNLPPQSRGRPIDVSYSSVDEKLKFMRAHNITTSVISLANPWLDFLSPEEGPKWARTINDELESLCSQHEGRLYGFATLPLSASPPGVISEVQRLSNLPHIKGIIFGTTGLGSGLDDPSLDPIWSSIQEKGMLIFLHPHYGLPASVYGSRAHEYGHVLPLSLGFPMETTIAFTQMWLSGVFDRFPKLKLLIAHAGGTLPFLAGRIDSCAQHERHFPAHDDGKRGPKRGLDSVLRENIWLDAVVYSETSIKAAIERVGQEKVLFGTDHPFFPPLEEGKEMWDSVKTNFDAVSEGNSTVSTLILGENAIRLLDLGLPERN
ncbi:hypothetical protein MMC21_002819 [Puttea exsequens]|nr:hypothetical protein [Puttea exsequens]